MEPVKLVAEHQTRLEPCFGQDESEACCLGEFCVCLEMCFRLCEVY